MKHESNTQTEVVRATASRRQFRLSISSDMEDIWRRLKDVRPRAAARDLEWLLRLGVLTESGLRAGGPAVATVLASLAAPRLAGGRSQPVSGAQERPATAAAAAPPGDDIEGSG